MADKPRNTYQQLKDQFLDKASKIDKITRTKALQLYYSIASTLQGKGINANDIMRQDPNRLISRLQPIHLGRLVSFYYNPKMQKELPYYDRFPIIIPFEYTADGFYGINFHYLPPKLRQTLLTTIIFNPSLQNQYQDEKKRVQLTYALLQRIVGRRKIKSAGGDTRWSNNILSPCIKRYLYSHVRSKFYVWEPNQYIFAIGLPVERFEKASKAQVWAESTVMSQERRR